MENLKELYLEHSQRVKDNVVEIKHIDLWSEQIGFLAEEHPFRAPATFLAYRILNADDAGDRTQQLRLQVDVYLFYETFADTKGGGKKQAHALSFLDLLTKLNACFHASSGNHFYGMRRTGFNPVETGTANLLYLQRYECTVNDASATVLAENMKFENVEVETAKDPGVPPAGGANLYGDIS